VIKGIYMLCSLVAAILGVIEKQKTQIVFAKLEQRLGAKFQIFVTVYAIN
jgi:hypothetical protein